jgi:HD-like signal output (HDOD) protein
LEVPRFRQPLRKQPMKVSCPDCKKTYDIPKDRLKEGIRTIFTCPACNKGTITIDLRKEMDEAASVAPTNPHLDFLGMAKGKDLKKKVVGRIKDLPPMPQVVMKAQEIMANPKTGMKELSELLETEPAIVAKVLKLANSAYYGVSGKIASLQHATVMLGNKALAEIITMAGMAGLLGLKLPGYGFDTGDLWRHSLAVAFGANSIARLKAPQFEDVAMISGLLHDTGKIILDPHIEERKEFFNEFMADGQQTFRDAELQIVGFDHAEIVSDVCKKWSIPDTIAKAVISHHEPPPGNRSELAHIIHLADYIARFSGIGTGSEDMLYVLCFDTLETLGISDEEINVILVDVINSVGKMAEIIQPG